MTIVLKFRSGRTEIVSFRRYTIAFPQAVKLRAGDEERRFHMGYILKTGTPVYYEAPVASPSAA